MPFHTIIEPTSEVYYVPPFRNPDLAWLFQRDGSKWAALERVPNHGFGVDDFPFRPSLFLSTDGGTSWSLQDAAGSPEGVGDLGPAYDCSFLGSGNLACFFDETRVFTFGVGYAYTCKVAIFDFATFTWGAPFAQFDIANVDAPASLSRALFALRPDGQYVLVLNNTSGVQAWLWNGAGWAAPVTLTGSGTATNLVIGSDNRAHVILSGDTCYLLDTDLTVLDSVPLTGVAMAGPLRIKSGALTSPAVVSSNLVIARGTPPNSPTWTEETVGLASAMSSSYFRADAAVLVNESGAVDIGWELDSSTDSTDIKTEVLSLVGSSGVLAMYWIGSDNASIWRSRKVGGVWSAASSIFSTADGTILSLAVRDSGGGGIGARYYADNR